MTGKAPKAPPTAHELAKRARARGERAAAVDYDRLASRTFPEDLTPEQAARWSRHPERYDIEGIDTPGRPKRNIGGRKGARAAAHRKIAVYGTKDEERIVRDTLDRDFTADELKKMAGRGMDVYVRPMAGREDGRTSGRTMQIDRYRATERTVIHEGIHALRRNDGSRRGASRSVLRSRGRMDADARSIEESQTVAEQIVREHGSGTADPYYWSVPVKDRKTGRWRSPTDAEAERMYREDVKLLSKQNDPSRAADDLWTQTNISRLRLGRKQAVNAAAERGMIGRRGGSPRKAAVRKTAPPVRRSPKISREEEYRDAMAYAEEERRDELVRQIMSEYSAKQIADKLKRYSGGDFGETAAVYMNKKYGARKLAEYIEYRDGLAEDPSMRRGWLEHRAKGRRK
ncbi:MAG: hypothetical protein VZQ28_01395 [Methanomethylophilus sp.]|nr:hypothetical protein [Methanomethylophilus sp.]